jgi:hypothetical protein
MLKNVSRQQTFVDSADHVGWYDASTLVELGQRSGLRLLKFAGIAVRNPKTVVAKLLFSVQPIIVRCGVSPLLFAKSIIYEFGLQK